VYHVSLTTAVKDLQRTLVAEARAGRRSVD